MQKGTVVNLSKLKGIIDFLKTNWCLITLTLSFILGIIFGTFWARGDISFSVLAKKFTENFISTRGSGDFFTIFSNSLFLNLAFLLLIFVFGTSVTGVSLAPILIFLRGLLFGALVSNVYSQFSLKGIAFNALILIPPTVIAVIFLIVSAKEAMSFSLSVINVTLPHTVPKNLSYLFNKFWKKHLLLLIPIILSSLLDGWLSVKLFSFFNL